jgi:hypothetical protein
MAGHDEADQGPGGRASGILEEEVADCRLSSETGINIDDRDRHS